MVWSIDVPPLFSRCLSLPLWCLLPLHAAVGLLRATLNTLMPGTKFALIATLRAFLLMFGLAVPVQAAEVTVFAAASLGDAFTDLAAAWETDTGHTVTLVLAGSSTLARQIEAGAPADVFVSANADWMDWLVEGGRVIADSRFDLASNRLVMVSEAEEVRSDQPVTSQTDMSALLGNEGRLAIALPDAVPAGIYAKAALTALGLWDGVKDRLAPTDNVRAALALVALGEAPLGIVYATDALAEPRVHVAGVFPKGTHPDIAYPAAVVSEADDVDRARAFLDWLRTDPAQSILAGHGFLPAGGHE